MISSELSINILDDSEQESTEDKQSIKRIKGTSNNDDPLDQQNITESQISLFEQAESVKKIGLFENLLQASYPLSLFVGLHICTEGIIRHSHSLDYFSFGYSQQPIQKVIEDKNFQVFNVVYQRNCPIKSNSLQDILQFLQRTPLIPFDFAYQTLDQVSQVVNYLTQRRLGSQIMDKSSLNQEEDLLAYLDYFGGVLEEYNKQNPNKMYWYSISRLNYAIQNTELIHTGFSKQYLDLLGIHPESLSQLFMRGKKIDLIQKKLDISLKTLKGLSQKGTKTSGYNNTIETHIVTFDGFPIKINQRQLFSCYIDNEREGEPKFKDFGYNITELDVDADQLKLLIDYRKRISDNSINLSIDDFIKRELSYQFEDVEYSVQSQEFIEKYYQKNLKKLKKIEKQQQKIQSKKCKYRFIKQ